ncbi:cysteine peptidase family C39 domain-containing protein [Vibrio splendidus]|uniref:cysteine peptidase family C39 domain-containing protein n=1 Tax=Vibrio chagasii TaxID=170679 RepID=UPI002284B844|nr:cysteine peptidase family C39 domain-containing protein [Vibrio chagasii]MCY9827440.1 cysteine peptidase family C39 domain-containing protein [Vibrio chagasii]
MNSIPYISQHWKKCCSKSELQDFDEKFLEEWSNRSCGLACVQMLLLHSQINYTNIVSLYEQAIEQEFYTPAGWIHSGLAELLSSRGVPAKAIPIEQEEICKGLAKGNMYIVSVTHKFPQNGCKGGHLVLLHSIDGEVVFFNDPSTWGESNKQLEKSVFFSSYSGRSIEVALNVF